MNNGRKKMATIIENWSKSEVRAVVRFLHAKGNNPTQIHNELVSVYGKDVMTKPGVYQWCSMFKAGRSSLDHAPGSGRPQSSLTDDNIARVDHLIREDRRRTIQDLADELGLPKTTAYRIVYEELGYRKVSARWVPKQLTDDHKVKRVEACHALLARHRDALAHHPGPDGDHLGTGSGDGEAGGPFLDNIITGDETWVHHTTPETKRQSMTWKHPSSPKPKKFKVTHSAKKLMATVFWDVRGILLVDFLPPGETINAARYCQTLDRLREAIRRKRPGHLTKGVTLQHDNATPHTAKMTQDWLKRHNWENLPHPPHSPDLAPSDFHLFGPLKQHLAGQRFDDDDDLTEEVTNWLKTLDEKFLRRGMYSLLHRWQKCIDLHGDYVEK